jgi:hypothetical protein
MRTEHKTEVQSRDQRAVNMTGTVLKDVDEGRRQGRKKGRKGIFPQIRSAMEYCMVCPAGKRKVISYKQVAGQLLE